MKRVGLIAMALIVLSLNGCSGSGEFSRGDGPPLFGANRPLPPDPVPRVEPRSRYGNPTSYVVLGRRYHVMAEASGYRERGVASWYGTKFHGRRTSSGETYDMHAMTAAHKSLPLPTYVAVTELNSGRRVVVRVNDRGPFHDNRIIDLSYSAARKLGITATGTGLVEVEALTPASHPPRQRVPAKSMPVRRTVAQPRTSPSQATQPQIYLQAGAFADANNATRLRARLASLADVPVAVSQAENAGVALHRVRLGPVRDVASADRLAQRIADAGMSLPRIVLE